MARCGLFVIAAVCIALTSADEQTEKQKALLQKCIQESGVTIDNIKAFIDSEPYPDGVRCLFKCLMQGHNALTENGTIDVEKIVAFAGESKRAAAEKCESDATSSDLCEKATQYHTCFLAHEPEFFKTTFKLLTT